MAQPDRDPGEVERQVDGQVSVRSLGRAIALQRPGGDGGSAIPRLRGFQGVGLSVDHSLALAGSRISGFAAIASGTGAFRWIDLGPELLAGALRLVLQAAWLPCTALLADLLPAQSRPSWASSIAMRSDGGPDSRSLVAAASSAFSQMRALCGRARFRRDVQARLLGLAWARCRPVPVVFGHARCPIRV